MEENTKIVPTHVSIIMDGNGRWAKARGLDRSAGHNKGAESLHVISEACRKAGVKYLSVFAFSEENWARSRDEVIHLMELMMEMMMAEKQTLIDNGIRFRVCGNRARLSEKFNAYVDEIEAVTAGNNDCTIIAFVSYSGKWDILQAAKKLALSCQGDPARIDALDYKDIDDALVTAGIPDPDLIIRTSGEQRLSNYLLWQGAYSEFYFTDVLWPDFREKEFFEALDAYAGRDRRYGKVK